MQTRHLLSTEKSEVIAFNDSLVIPRMEERIRMDTAWVDSLTYDTIVEEIYALLCRM